MIARIIIAAALAGLVAGLAVAAIQQVRVTPLIHAAEKYEQAEAAGRDPAARRGRLGTGGWA